MPSLEWYAGQREIGKEEQSEIEGRRNKWTVKKKERKSKQSQEKIQRDANTNTKSIK
jgi:hypothetical protein